MLTPAQFITKYTNVLINNGGTQCPAVFNQQEAEVVGGGFIGTPLTGYASDIWNNWGNDTDYNNYLRILPNQPAQLGDSAVWSKYPTSGLPHVAYVNHDNGNTLNCLTQNPGKAHIENLVKTNLLGYLRPKKFVNQIITASAPIAAPAVPSKGKVTLPANITSWNLYNEAGPYIKGKQKAVLNPSQFGGLTYDILSRPVANVVVIQTQMFGRGAIYVGPDTPARFS